MRRSQAFFLQIGERFFENLFRTRSVSSKVGFAAGSRAGLRAVEKLFGGLGDHETVSEAAVERSARFPGRLFAPLDLASLVLFRIAFGLIMLWECGRYLKYGWIQSFYMKPDFYFKYHGFEWVQPWPGDGMYYHFLALGILAVLITMGLFYRWATVLFFFGFTYIFLLDQTRYLNHFYLIALVSFLMIFLPAHRTYSLDARRRPTLRSESAPAWTLWLLRAQIGIVYFYAGIAKINSDWLHGEPMRKWLKARDEFPLIGRLFDDEWCVYLFSYGGLLLDLSAAFLLVVSRTRPFIFAVIVAFHLMNVFLFDIGIFPWFMIAATALFFRPDWPRRVCLLLPRLRVDAPTSTCLASTSPITRRQWVTAGLIAAYLLVQLVVPLRHFAYSGDVHWNEEGHNFSWHMKLRDKSGKTRIRVTDPKQRVTREIRLGDYLTSKQIRKMSGRPDMILQFCHYIADRMRDSGQEEIEVRADSRVSLNGRARQPLIDSRVDLSRAPRTVAPYEWVLPLNEPLQSQR